MYGLVNRAIQDMICEWYGDSTWQSVKQKAEVFEEQFLCSEAYPDDLTHRLVKAASEVLNLSSTEIMQAFGEYWIEFTGKAGYQEILEISGDTLPEFLENLDNLHTRIRVQFPKFSPPAFDCIQENQTVLELHYRSTRNSFAPMVIGLVKGLGDRFHTQVQITQTASREQNGEHDVFRIEHQSK